MGFIQHANARDSDDNKTANLRNLRMEGILLIPLISSVIMFTYFIMEKWCNGDIIFNSALMTV